MGNEVVRYSEFEAPSPWLALYYDSVGNVYESGTTYASVRFETEEDSVQIALVARSAEAGSLSIRCTSEERTPRGAGPSQWSPSHGRVIVITFPVPPTANTEWEWDFTEAERPTPLKLKVKIRRPAR